MVIPFGFMSAMKKYGIDFAALFDGSSGNFSRSYITNQGNSATLSFWIQRNKIGIQTPIMSMTFTTTFTWKHVIKFNSNDQLYVADYRNDVGWYTTFTSNMKFRDIGGWYHIVIVNDSVNGIKFYVNGQLISHAVGGTGPISYSNYFFGSIGESMSSYLFYDIADAGGYANANLADFNYLLGSQLPSSFGETDPNTGNWKAKKYTGTYGTNGFYLDFSDNTNLGKDVSGNGNHWTVTGGVTQITSTPTNTYATFSPLVPQQGDVSFSGGNTAVSHTASAYVYRTTVSPFGMSSGKWYWEITVPDGAIGNNTNVVYHGVTNNLMHGNATGLGTTTEGWCIQSGNGYKKNNNSAVVYSGISGFQNSTPIGIALDADNGYIWFNVNGVWGGGATIGEIESSNSTNAAFTNLTGTIYPVMGNYGSNCGATYNFGAKPFNLTQPVGYNSLCTDNLPVVNDNVNNHFTTVLTTGDNVSPRVITTGLPSTDFVWVKSRNNARNHGIADSVRGGARTICTDLTDAESTGYSLGFNGSGCVDSFGTDNFTVVSGVNMNNVNTTGYTYVWWCTSLPNTDIPTGGTITPTGCRYNSTLGMAILTYTGNGVAGATLPHPCGKKPGMMIIKRLDGNFSWAIYHKSAGATKVLQFDMSAAFTDLSSWNNTEPTVSLISLGDAGAVNANNAAYEIIIFYETDFCKIGSYFGNAVVDGPYLNLGVSPVWWLSKDNSASTPWDLYDSVRNPSNTSSSKNQLRPESSATENSYYPGTFDFTSTGIKIRSDTTMSYINYVQEHFYIIIGQPNSPKENLGR